MDCFDSLEKKEIPLENESEQLIQRRKVSTRNSVDKAQCDAYANSWRCPCHGRSSTEALPKPFPVSMEIYETLVESRAMELKSAWMKDRHLMRDICICRKPRS